MVVIEVKVHQVYRHGETLANSNGVVPRAQERYLPIRRCLGKCRRTLPSTRKRRRLRGGVLQRSVRCLVSGLWLALGSGLHPVQADTGTVQFTGLWPGSRIIIDNTPVLAPAGKIQLPVGEHFLQIEAFQPPSGPVTADQVPEVPLTGVMVFRTCIAVEAGVIRTVTVRPVPVYPTNAGYADFAVTPAGPMGPGGLPGRAADLQQPLDTAAARKVLVEALQNQFYQLEGLCLEIEQDRRRHHEILMPPPVLWYSPTGEPAIILPILGPLGPLGPPGPPGNPGDIARLKDDRGHLLLTRLVTELKLAEWRQTLTDLHRRWQRLPVPPFLQNRLQSVPLYTFDLRRRLDAAYARLGNGERRCIIRGSSDDRPTPRPGWPGAQGPAGADGTLPAEAGDPARYQVTYSAAMVQQLLLALEQDTAFQAQLKKLRDRVERLRQQTAEAEAQATQAPQCRPPYQPAPPPR